MDNFLVLVGILAVGIHLLYGYARFARAAELREPSTRGDIQSLSASIGTLKWRSARSAPTSAASKTNSATCAQRSAIAAVSAPNVAGIREDLDSTREDLDGIHSDLAAMRRLLKAIAHHQWTPEWTPSE